MTPALALALLAGCAPDEAPADGLVLLSPREQLIRVSVDLRGIHPTEEELLAIEEHPGLYDDFVDRYLQDPRFLDRIEEVFNARFLTRTGETWFDPADAGLGGIPERVVAASLAAEPLRLVRHIVENDLPYSEIVTADYTMADRIVARMWNLDGPDGEGWATARYQDGRPMAGVLSMQTIWQRYPSMGGNANRHRANAVSRMLLCEDYLERPIVLNRASIDQLTIDPEEAIQSETCQSCHASLDPLSAHFFGWFRYDAADDLREATTYLPENEEGWREYAGKAPGYFGRPTANLHELADAIVADPRFADCAAQTLWEGFSQRARTDADWASFAATRDVLVENGLVLRPAVRQVVTSREYLAGGATDPSVADRVSSVRTASPAQLASIIEDLTGYRWTFDGADGLTDPTSGLVVLGGGVDSRYVTIPTYEPSVGTAFVVERLAQSAGWAVADHDLDPERTEPAILLAYVTAADTPDTRPDVFEAQIRALYLRITGLPLAESAPEPAQLAALWKQLYSVEGSSTRAWAGVLSAILRDPRVLFY